MGISDTQNANDVYLRAGTYLAPSVDSFWRWSSDGSALTWADGKTIAFLPEAAAVLKRLAPAGLPPFGAVVLLLAACRDGWEASEGRKTVRWFGRAVRQWHTESSLAGPAAGVAFGRVAEEIDQIILGLDRAAALPPEVRSGVDAKAVLAETVFEPSDREARGGPGTRGPRRLSREDSKAVLEAIEEGIDPALLLQRLSERQSVAQFAGEVEGLKPGLDRVNAESLALRARTGLDQPVGPADADLAPSERVRQLLADLRDDRELAGVVRLARNLMAAATVPRALHARDEMPLGGVSDLSNRGALDRLLVSELAHDDLTLAVRVATGEALYLRREAPPKEPPGRRAILLDCGIRLWGLPRVYSVAVAVAMAATAEKNADLVVYRATRDGVESQDLTTRAGLVSCLAALEPEPHPGRALAAFFQAVREREQMALAPPGAAGTTDAVLITHPDVVADPAFAAALSGAAAPEAVSLYLATVARDGAFGLFAQTAAGRKRVREAAISLDVLLEPPAPRPAGGAQPAQSAPLRVRGLDPALPVILSLDFFPLRLPCVAEAQFAAASPRHGLVAATRDGRLMHWDGPQRGARQITPLLPRGVARGVFIDEDAARVSAVIFHRRTGLAHLVTADLRCSNDRCQQVLLQTSEPDPVGLAVRHGVLFVIYAAQAEAFDLASGRRLGQAALPRLSIWRGGRFFRDDDGTWFAMAYRGTDLIFEEVPRIATPPRQVLRLFDRADEGPIAVVDDGRIVSTDRGATPYVLLERVVDVTGVSADGSRITVRCGEREHRLVDLAAGGVQHRFTRDPAEALLAPQIDWSLRSSVSPRTRFRGISFGPRGELSLTTRQYTTLTIALNGHGELALTDHGRSDPQPHWLKIFTHHGRVPGMRFNLDAAHWSDGSRAYLDSRGMLHLVSSDPSVPQVTLTLSTAAALAGWSSAGKMFGPPYFIGDAAATDAGYFDQVIHAFTSRLR